MYSHQETYDQCIDGLRIQWCVARDNVSPKSGCTNLNEYGERCAAGQLMPGDTGRACDGTCSPHTQAAEYLLKLGYDAAFCRELQLLHDTRDDVSMWEFEFLCFAKKHGLEYRPA